MQLRQGLIVGLLALLVGCVSLPPQVSLRERVDQLSHQQEYASALQLIDSVTANHPDHAELVVQRVNILALARQYEEQVIQEAASAAAQGQWTEAFSRYEQAMRRLPASSELTTSHQRMEQFYQRERAALELELMLARADWLHNSLKLVQTNTQWDVGNDSVSQRTRQWQAEAITLADTLTDAGEKSLASGELSQAKRIITAALRLNTTPRLQQANQRLQGLLTDAEQRQLARQARQEQTRRERDTKQQLEQQQRFTQQTFKEAERAFAAGDLPRAHQLVSQLGHDEAQVKALHAQVDSAINSEINKHHDIGATLYSQGKFTEAITHWRHILRLDPNDTNAKLHLDRAERVLSRLRQLKRQQAH